MLLFAKKRRLLWTLLIHDLLTGTFEMFPKAAKTELLPDTAVLGENVGQNIKPMDFFPQHAGFRSSGSVEDFINISKSGFRCVLSYNKAVLRTDESSFQGFVGFQILSMDWKVMTQLLT